MTLVQISNLFGVSMDYLLKEDCEEKAVSGSGYYVSREMLDGYLSYSRQNVKQITAGIIIIIWYFFQPKQYQEIKNEHLTFDDKVFEEFKKQRENRRKKYAVMIIVGVVILLVSSEMGHFIMIYFGQAACNVFEWAADTVWLALIIWAGMSMHIDTIIIKNAEHTPESGHMKRYRWIYAALPVTVAAVLIGMITNAWSPYAPVIILFCCLLITTCKLLIESKGKR